MNTARLAGVVVALAAAVTPAAAAAAPARLPTTLARRVTADGVNRHLIALQRITDRNGGQRYDPSPGFQESLNYVAGKVRAAGFDVSLQEFAYDRKVIDAASIVAGSTRLSAIQMGHIEHTVSHNLIARPARDARTT